MKVKLAELSKKGLHYIDCLCEIKWAESLTHPCLKMTLLTIAKESRLILQNIQRRGVLIIISFKCYLDYAFACKFESKVSGCFRLPVVLMI